MHSDHSAAQMVTSERWSELVHFANGDAKEKANRRTPRPRRTMLCDLRDLLYYFSSLSPFLRYPFTTPARMLELPCMTQNNRFCDSHPAFCAAAVIVLLAAPMAVGASDTANVVGGLYFPPPGQSMENQDRRRPQEVGLDAAVAERINRFVEDNPAHP
jgi:hypothetical protein